ncbi:MAG: hypothetical protein ACRDTJ_03860 [Pseudonocardiaceae bacterium]
MTTATEATLADLRDRLAYCESMTAAAYGDVTRVAVWGCQARRIRDQIKELEK